MPFRHAHWWLLGLFPFIGLAFWSGYLSKLADSPWMFHLHGITATLWLILLIIQSWSIQNGHRTFHRTNGLVSFALFPLFLAGGAAVFIGEAQGFVAKSSPFYELYPPRLAWIDFVAVGGMAYFYYQALRYRRWVGKHAGYMLATAIFLLSPIFGRLAPFVMGINPTQPDFWERLHTGFQIGNAATIAVALLIGWRAGRNGRPFFAAAGLSLVAMILFEYPGGSRSWWEIFAKFAQFPPVALCLVAAAAGAVIGWAGWQTGKRAPIKVATI